MKTTISLDDHIYRAIKQLAEAEGLRVSAFIASVLEDAVKSGFCTQEGRPFRLVTEGGGRLYPEIDLDRHGEITSAEDEERHGRHALPT